MTGASRLIILTKDGITSFTSAPSSSATRPSFSPSEITIQRVKNDFMPRAGHLDDDAGESSFNVPSPTLPRPSALTYIFAAIFISRRRLLPRDARHRR